MAVYNKQDLIVGAGEQIPTTIVQAVCTENKLGTTGKGDPKWQMEFVIYAPEDTEFDGRQVALAGQTFTIHQNISPGDKNGLPVCYSKLEQSGFDFSKFGAGGALDTDRPDAVVGHAVSIAIESQQDLIRKTQTESDKAAGKKAEFLLGPDKKPISRGFRINPGIGLQNVLGPATVEPPQFE